MSIKFLTVENCRALLIASLISGGSLLSVESTLAQQATPGAITNTATAEFTDAADTATNPTSIKIVSDTVTVTVVEIAGITATGIPTSSEVSRTKVVFFDFKISNVGNDPTQFFIPGKPSSVTSKRGTITTDITTTATIGSLKVIAYNATGTGADTLVDKDNIVPLAGSTTGGLTANTGTTAITSKSIPADGYIIVRVPVTVPLSALAGDKIAVTLGNTLNQPATSNTPYILGANGVTSTGDDLYTQDNATSDGIAGEATGDPSNGNIPDHRQETSAIREETVVNPALITISGTVYDDRDNSGATGATPAVRFANIITNSEVGTNAVFGTSVVPVNVILVDLTNGDNKVLAVKKLTSNGAYSFPNIFAASDVKIFISTDDSITAGTVLNTAQLTSLVSVPTGWVNTAPSDNSFRTAASIVQNFGIRQKASLLLLKRITKINGVDVPTTAGTDTVNTTGNVNWPTTTLLKGSVGGVASPVNVKPGDKVEYTIYFINNQGAEAKNIKICDPILGSQTFLNGQYPGGKDLELKMGDDLALGLTSSTDTADRASLYAGNAKPVGCGISSASTAPGVVVEITGTAATGAVQPALTGIPGATGVGTATPSTLKPYGLIRFTTTINERPAI